MMIIIVKNIPQNEVTKRVNTHQEDIHKESKNTVVMGKIYNKKGSIFVIARIFNTRVSREGVLATLLHFWGENTYFLHLFSHFEG